MIRPNEEQNMAIKTHGNILLKAGAGSGKTFVLVRHVAFVLEEFLTAKGHLNERGLIKELKRYLSSMALITYTKKAAGELNLRLRLHLAEKAKLVGGQWPIVEQYIDYLTVGTVHSFFLKLLRQGCFPEYGKDFTVVEGNYKIRKKIRKLFRDWLDGHLVGDIQKIQEKTSLWAIASDINSVERALQKIFEKPDLRICWEQEISSKTNDGHILRAILELQGLDEFLMKPISLALPKKKRKWVDFYFAFEKLKREKPFTFKIAKEYLDFIPANLRSSGHSEDAKQYIEMAKKLKNFLKKNEDSFSYYNKEKIESWRRAFKEIFFYINQRYELLQEFSFADIEYYTKKGLQHSRNKKRAQEKISYIIIDEFQDISMIQYEIIKDIIGNDFKKIYCVGDEKQAIYGFRGGDLGVFSDAESRTRDHYGLNMNYRSVKSIIDFNNVFFQNIFQKKTTFQQCYEAKQKEIGVTRHKLEIESDKNKKSLGQSEIDKVEAIKIHEIIKESLGKYPDRKICVLYRKRSPSLYLINSLVNDQVSFQAQVKVPENDDPIMAIFKVLLEGFLGKEDVRGYCIFILENILKHLHFFSSVEKSFDRFYNNIVIVGLQTALRTFMLELGIYNCNYKHNLKTIEEMISANFEDIHSIYEEVCRLGKGYIIDFHVGQSSSQITLMTVHAAKGLEFDHVILGGIHTNGKMDNTMGILGEKPESFKWKDGASSKSFMKTPGLILEELITKDKELAESKRLLYVACTRAKAQLSWVDISFQEKEVFYSDKSWIVDLRKFNKIENIFLQKRSLEDFTFSMEKNVPLFHRDSLGQTLIEGKGELVGYFSNLSVSRLSLLEQCPRKFYLKNICGLDDDQGHNMIIKYSEEKALEKEGSGFVLRESMKRRGDRIHEAISEIVKNDFEEKIYRQDSEVVDWAINYIKQFKGRFSFLSEEPIQLDIFGTIITGRIDLLCFPKIKDEKIRIIDFKTGKRKEYAESVYWFQLISYAYAVFQKYPNDAPSYILEICYVDEKKSVSREMPILEIEKFIFNRWPLLTSLNQVELNHCSVCGFGKICH